MVGARSRNWQEVAWNVAHWEQDGAGCPSQCGGGWRGRPSSTRIPSSGYPLDTSRPPIGRPVQQRRGHHMDFESIRELVYVDRNGFEVQPLPRRAFYEEGDRFGYDRLTIPYNNTQSLQFSIPPLRGLGPDMGGPYPMVAPSQMMMPSSDRRAQCPIAMPSRLRVPSGESFNPDNSSSRERGHAKDSVHTTQTQKNLSSGRKKRWDAQHVYEAEEADRKACSLKSHAIGCDNTGLPDEIGRLGSRFLEVLKAFCTIFSFYPLSRLGCKIPMIMPVCMKNWGLNSSGLDTKYRRWALREPSQSAWKLNGHVYISCTTQNRIGTAHPREEPCVWEKLKAYWKLPEFEKMSKVSSICYKLQTLSLICMLLGWKLSTWLEIVRCCISTLQYSLGGVGWI